MFERRPSPRITVNNSSIDLGCDFFLMQTLSLKVFDMGSNDLKKP